MIPSIVTRRNGRRPWRPVLWGYDADQTVAAFAARLKDTVALDSVREDLAGVVHQALEPSHVSVWISECG